MNSIEITLNFNPTTTCVYVCSQIRAKKEENKIIITITTIATAGTMRYGILYHIHRRDAIDAFSVNSTMYSILMC